MREENFEQYFKTLRMIRDEFGYLIYVNPIPIQFIYIQIIFDQIWIRFGLRLFRYQIYSKIFRSQSEFRVMQSE